MNSQTFIKLLLALLSMIIVFHFCIIAKIIPYNVAWGGRIQDDTQMYVFETISIMINLFLGFILLMKGDYIKFQFRQKTLDVVLWIFLVIFILNTVGNLFAKTNFEKFFAVLTLFLAFLIWKVLRKNNNERTTNKTSRGI